MCYAKQRDFDVFAGKTEVATNKNVKFYYFVLHSKNLTMTGCCLLCFTLFENMYS